jgi:hypothetical protein
MVGVYNEKEYTRGNTKLFQDARHTIKREQRLEMGAERKMVKVTQHNFYLFLV